MKADAISNIAYVFVGAYAMSSGDIAPGLAVIFLGISSYLGHSRRGEWWRLDWIGMYAAFTAIICHNASLSYLAVPIVAAIGGKYGYNNAPGYALIGILAVLSLITAHMSGLGVALPAALYVTGLVFQRIAEAHGQDSDTYQALHSLWHIETAVAILRSIA
jgi:hypothetical protein